MYIDLKILDVSRKVIKYFQKIFIFWQSCINLVSLLSNDTVPFWTDSLHLQLQEHNDSEPAGGSGHWDQRQGSTVRWHAPSRDQCCPLHLQTVTVSPLHEKKGGGSKYYVHT